MAKESGLGMTVTVDDSGGTGRAITNDVLSVQFAMPSDLQDVTGLDKSAKERLYLLADFSITLNAAFNDVATTGIFQIFKNYRTLFTAQLGRTTAIVHSGDTLSNEVIYSDFSWNRGANGDLLVTAPGVLADGTLPVWS
jgi:hypothetical protein